MGIADFFGFGKKEEIKKKPFRIPVEASAISTIIDAENRENYPKPARYQEIVKQVEVVIDHLDMIIGHGEYAKEAYRIKKDIKKKMGLLTEKVNKNKTAARKEGNEDYVANNLEYLERKGMRDQAKTLFIKCLDAIESMMNCCQVERAKDGATIESATVELISAMSALRHDYFQEHGDDIEIKNIREELMRKIERLNTFFKENKDKIKEKGLEDQALSTLVEIAGEMEKLSEI